MYIDIYSAFDVRHVFLCHPIMGKTKLCIILLLVEMHDSYDVHNKVIEPTSILLMCGFYTKTEVY